MALDKNSTEIVINGRDATQRAFDSIEKRYDSLAAKGKLFSTSVASLAMAVPVASLVSFTRRSIDAMDALNDLSVRTGIAVEELTGWEYAVKLSDTSMQALTGTLSIVKKNMTASADEFKRLGLDGATATEVILQLSDVISAMPMDDPRRMALAMKVMGKSAQEMMPLLAGGSDELRKMLEVGRELNPVTDDMAVQAAKLNDEMDKLSIALDGIGSNLAMKFLPGLNQIIDKFNEGETAGRGFWMSLGGAYAEYAKVLFTGSDYENRISRMETLQKTLGVLSSELSDMEAQMQASRSKGNAIDAGEVVVFDNKAYQAKIDQARKLGAELQKIAMEHNKNVKVPSSGPNSAKEAEAEAKAIVTARLAMRGAMLDADKSIGAAQQKSALDEIESQLKSSLISYSDYYARREAIQVEYFNGESERLAQRISMEKLDAARLRSSGDEAGALGKDSNVVRLQAELSVLRNEQTLAMTGIARAAEQANMEIGKQMLDLNAKLLNAQGQYGDAAVIDIASKYGDMIKRMGVEGNTAGLELIDKLINIEYADARMSELENRYSRMLVDLNSQEKSIDVQKSTGLLTEFEARQRLLKIYKEQLAVRRLELTEAKAIAAQSGTPSNQNRVMNLASDIQYLEAVTSEANRTFEYGARSAVGEYFDTISNRAEQARETYVTAFKSMEDSLAKFFKTGKLDMNSFFDAMENRIAQMMAQRAMEDIFGAVGGGNAFGFIGELLGGSGSSSGGGNSSPGIDLSYLFSAKGNAFDNGDVLKFAKGGAFTNKVVDSPVVFPLGVMGEKDAEAIMPLGRDASGRLGVHVVGSSDSGGAPVLVSVNIIGAPSQPEVQTSSGDNGEMTIDIIFEQAEEYMGRRMEQGRGLAQVMEGKYGLNPAAGAMG